MSTQWMTLPPFVLARLAACGVDADQALRQACPPSPSMRARTCA
jgi:hypothetical protein